MRMNRKYVKYRLPPSVPGLAKNVKSYDLTPPPVTKSPINSRRRGRP